MIRLGITGYGNLGKALEKLAVKAKDIVPVAVFTRRDGVTSDLGTPCVSYSDFESYKGKIDVMAICSGSANDVPVQGRQLAGIFNTVDSFDTHALIPDYYKDMDSIAVKNGTVSIISAGWDPGLFSYMRLLFATAIEDGDSYTFWGKGVSQGHSDAIRRIEGVKNGKQYTIPKQSALDSVRAGERPVLAAGDKHLRECFVVAEDGADKARIEKEIKTMPYYFDEYETVVHFINEETFVKEHSGMPHGGMVIRSGSINGTAHTAELDINLGSNPDFTAALVLSYVRAAARMSAEGLKGAKTVFDVPVSYMTDIDINEAIKHLL